MGCGMSLPGNATNLGFQPILKKLEDLRQNDRVSVTVDHETPFAKLLLKDAEGHVIPNTDVRRTSISSTSLEPKKSLNIAHGDSMIKKNVAYEKGKEAAKRGDIKKHGERGEEEESDYNDDEDEEGRVSDYDGSALWIGSPSFREYCTNGCESEEDSFKDGGKITFEKYIIAI